MNNKRDSAYDKELDNLYDEMKLRQIKLNQYDEEILNPYDTRKCLAVFDLTKNMMSNNFNSLLNDLDKLKSCGVLFKPDNNNKQYGYLHLTLMQLISFDKFKHDYMTSNLEKYKTIISKYIKNIIIRVRYRHLIVVSNGILICAYPDTNINNIRENIRRDILESKLELHEPYKNNICHSTLFRFTRQLTNDEIHLLMEIIKKYDNTDLGEVVYDSFITDTSTYLQNQYIL